MKTIVATRGSDHDAQDAVHSEVEVSVVMPCLNEAETLATCISEAQRALAEAEMNGEIIVADNGSIDGSQEIAEKLGARVVSVVERGYGSALRGGIHASRGRYVVMGDSDASYDFGHVPRIVAKLREGFDLVMGNRFAGGIEPGAMPWLHRYLGNPVLTGIGRLFFRCPAGDFHCGLRGFTRSAYDRMGLSTTGMEFASEMVIKSTLRGLRITEVPTILRPDGRSRPPHLRSWRDGWRHLRFMLLYCPRWLFIITGMPVFLLGLILVMLIGIIRHVPFCGAVLNVNTSIAGAMMASLGYHLLLVGVFARRFGVAIGTHPQNSVLKLLQRRLSLEHGVVVGVLLACIGLLLLLSAVLSWQAAGFGVMHSDLTVSRVIPAVVLITLGIQTVFGSFFLSLISLIPRSDGQG
jgi:glycosyltransferase involved in cell wall biosynthesis